jgi:hypothetical protein
MNSHPEIAQAATPIIIFPSGICKYGRVYHATIIKRQELHITSNESHPGGSAIKLAWAFKSLAIMKKNGLGSVPVILPDSASIICRN